MNTPRMLTVIAFALASVAAPAAHAGAGDLVLTKRVSYADLDLERTEDVQQLYRRLRSAAREVCRHAAAPNTFSTDCAREALETSVATVNVPALVAVHEASRR